LQNKRLTLVLLLIAYGMSDNAGIQEALEESSHSKQFAKTVLSPRLINLANSSGAGV